MKNINIKQEVQSILNEKQLAIFEKIISFTWASLAYAIKETLNDLALSYIRSERIVGDNQATRDNIAFHLYLLGQLIDDLRDLELNVFQIDEKKSKFSRDIIGLNGWSDETYDIKNSINDLSLVYVRSEDASNDRQDTRENLAFHLHLLNSLVQDLSDFETSNN